VLVFINKKGKNIFTRWGDQALPKTKEKKAKTSSETKIRNTTTVAEKNE
jgi:hypothetical protein